MLDDGGYALSDALSDQTFTDTDGVRQPVILEEPIAGSAPELLQVVVKNIESRSPASEERHESREELLAEGSQRSGALQCGGNVRNVYLDPPLFGSLRGTLLQDIDRSGEVARFVLRLCIRNVLPVVPGR